MRWAMVEPLNHLRPVGFHVTSKIYSRTSPQESHMAFSPSTITTKRPPATAKTAFFLCFRPENPTARTPVTIAIRAISVIGLSKSSL